MKKLQFTDPKYHDQSANMKGIKNIQIRFHRVFNDNK